jgi:hypothetical protein
MPASPDPVARVRAASEHGGLGPQGGVPRPPEPVVPVSEDAEVVDVGGEPALRRREIAAVQREQGVEGRSPAGELPWVSAGVDGDAHPGRLALVVAAHAVHHRDGVRRAAQCRRDRPSGTLPPDAEQLSGLHDVVETAGERVDHEPPAGGEVVLVPVERQPAERRGVCGGSGQVTGGHRDVGRHQQAVTELEPAQRSDRHRG